MSYLLTRVVGPRAPAHPTLLIEAPHGATTLAHYRRIASQMRSDLPDGLHTFFTMNTDVGSPELVHALAFAWVKTHPDAHVLVLRCTVPRTLIDVNRLLEGTAGDLTRGDLTAAIPPYIDHDDDRAALLGLHRDYTEAAEACFEQVCGRGFPAWIVHTYGPRSVGIARVDRDIVQNLRRVHAPDQVDRWPWRAEVDLITHSPEGDLLAPEAEVERVASSLRRSGYQVTQNDTYKLAPVAMGSVWSARWPGQVLCFEVRRDLLVDQWVWDQEMQVNPDSVARFAEAFVAGWGGA